MMASDMNWRTKEASWWDRLFAHLIDQLMIYVPLNFGVVSLTLQIPKSTWIIIVLSFAGLLTKLVCETCWGGTPGKWLMNVRLVSNVRRISFAKVLARNTLPIILSLLNAYSLSLYLDSPFSPYISNADEYGFLSTSVTPLFIVVGTSICFVLYFLECAYAMVNDNRLPLHDILFQVECEKRERRMLGSKRPTEDEMEAIDWGKIGGKTSSLEVRGERAESGVGPEATSSTVTNSPLTTAPSTTAPSTTAPVPRRKPRVNSVSCLFTLIAFLAVLGLGASIIPRVVDKDAARQKAQKRIANIVEPRIESQKQAEEKRRETLATTLAVLKEKSSASLGPTEYSSGLTHHDERWAKVKLDANQYENGDAALVMFAVSSVDPLDRLELTSVDDIGISTSVHELKLAENFGVATFANLPAGSYRVAFQTRLVSGEWKELAISPQFVVQEVVVQSESQIAAINASYKTMRPRVRVDRTRANPERPVQVIYEGIPANHGVQFVAAPFQQPFGSESDGMRKTLSDSAGSFDYEIDSELYDIKRAGQMELRFYFFDAANRELPQPEIILPCSVLAKNYQDFEVETYQSVFKVGQDIPISITGKNGRLPGASYLMLVNQNLKRRPVVQLTRTLSGVEPGLYEIQFVRGSADKTLLTSWTRVRIEEDRDDSGSEGERK